MTEREGCPRFGAISFLEARLIRPVAVEALQSDEEVQARVTGDGILFRSRRQDVRAFISSSVESVSWVSHKQPHCQKVRQHTSMHKSPVAQTRGTSRPQPAALSGSRERWAGLGEEWERRATYHSHHHEPYAGSVKVGGAARCLLNGSRAGSSDIHVGVTRRASQRSIMAPP